MSVPCQSCSLTHAYRRSREVVNRKYGRHGPFRNTQIDLHVRSEGGGWGEAAAGMQTRPSHVGGGTGWVTHLVVQCPAQVRNGEEPDDVADRRVPPSGDVMVEIVARRLFVACVRIKVPVYGPPK